MFDSTLLVSASSGAKVKRGTILLEYLPAQAILGTATDRMVTTAAGVDRVMSTVSTLFLACNTATPFFLGSMSILWGLINSLQIIAHIPLLNVKMPANASILYELVYTLANFKLFSSLFGDVSE